MWFLCIGVTAPSLYKTDQPITNDAKLLFSYRQTRVTLGGGRSQLCR